MAKILKHPCGEVIDDFDPNNSQQEATRLKAAINMRDDPETKILAEQILGVEFCRQRFPEAYGEN